MIGARELARMRPGSFLINTARGAVVDARASAEALRAGRLAGAGVDVFDPEVPPPDHPLLKCPNAILSPHNAAQTPEARLNYASVVLDLLRVLDGKKPLFPASD
jgi:phosphoglycerate dehydrogenase-like enzyme